MAIQRAGRPHLKRINLVSVTCLIECYRSVKDLIDGTSSHRREKTWCLMLKGVLSNGARIKMMKMILVFPIMIVCCEFVEWTE